MTAAEGCVTQVLRPAQVKQIVWLGGTELWSFSETSAVFTSLNRGLTST